MNSCNFVGTVDGDIIVEQEGNVKVARFMLCIAEIRKAKSDGENVRMSTSVGMEAWHTAALNISHNCKHGDRLSVQSSVRYDRQTEEVYFRVNNFEVLK